MNICAIIPTYNNAKTLEEVVDSVARYLNDIIVVDDGSDSLALNCARKLAAKNKCILLERAKNGGKGAAVKSGLMEAHRRQFTHALQIDADLQHDPNDIPALLAQARGCPDGLILALPRFDSTAPRSRLYARKISQFWVQLETWSTEIGDPLCGYRVYNISAALRTNTVGDAMDFDPEIAVRLVWQGATVKHVPTSVRYIPKAEGGVSHFRIGFDTALISWAHTRLCMEGLMRLNKKLIPKAVSLIKLSIALFLKQKNG